MRSQLLDRRRFLSMGVVAAGAAMVGANGWPALLPKSASEDRPRWSDPNTWGGRVPSPGEWVSLDRPVVLDVDANVGGLAIQPGGALIFDPYRSCTLTSTANVVVMGLLQLRPASAPVNHVVRFIDVDESRFVGGGHEVLDTDIGLWTMHDGLLDVAGTPRRAWARTSSSVAAGAETITLQVDPVGWQVGDEVAIVPTLGPEHWNHHDAYDYATVTFVTGTTVGLSTPTRYAHPAVDVGNGVVVAPEVLNLTRNVNIEGTAGGRAHIIFAHTGKPQQMSYFATRWMGPRQLTGEKDFTRSVLGRYGLHFHMAGDASRGGNVVGGVVRDAGSHAFVAHESHGVTFTSCISHNTFDDAYWWDGMVNTRTPGPDTHDVLYETCIASRVLCNPTFRGYRLSGFALGAGAGNRTLDCVAVGVQGNGHASGFKWPEGPTSGVWEFNRNISHNNKCNGIFTWQNTKSPHVVENFVCYHNGIAGINHGAYLTSYLYRNGYLFRNGTSSVALHSNSFSESPQRFVGLHCEAQPGTAHAVQVMKHTLEPGRPTEFIDCTFNGQSKAAIGMVYGGNNGATTRELFDVIHCASTSPLLWLRDDTAPDSIVRVQTADEVVAATPLGTTGVLRPEWNALITPISEFASQPAESLPMPFSIAGGGVLGESSSQTPVESSTSTTTTTDTSTTTTTAPADTTTTTTTAPADTTTTTTTTTTAPPETSTTTTDESTQTLEEPAKSNGKAFRQTDDPKPGGKGGRKK